MGEPGKPRKIPRDQNVRDHRNDVGVDQDHRNNVGVDQDHRNNVGVDQDHRNDVGVDQDHRNVCELLTPFRVTLGSS